MLRYLKPWEKKYDVSLAEIEYRKWDYYGPFVRFKLTKILDRVIAAPMELRQETVEVSESDFKLLSRATKELYQMLGEHLLVLKTLHLDVKINSENTEELIKEKILEMRLF